MAANVNPQVQPDVATQPHPGAVDAGPASNDPEAGASQLQDVLPEISQVAQKVGGFKKLAEIADTLDEMGK